MILRRPKPVPDQWSDGFWAAAASGVLAIQRCQRCQRRFHPTVAMCADCASTDLAFEPVSGRGTVSTYSVSHVSRIESFSAEGPFVVAWISLDDDPSIVLVTNLPGTAPEEIEIGMPVEVCFEQIDDEFVLPQFKAVEV